MPHFSVGPGSASTSASKTDSQTKSKKGSGTDIEPDLESQLIDQTKYQIRVLAQEIAELAQSDCEPPDFYQGFLTRMTTALASIGGAVWLRENPEVGLSLQYHINLKQTRLASDKQAQVQHSLLLERLLASGEPMLVQPNSGNDKPDEAGNPTEFLLVIAPIRVNNEAVGLVEILQRANSGPTTQMGYLRFVTQMAELAGDYLTNQRLRTFAQAESMWQQLEAFICSVHGGLDKKQVAYSIVNEGRRLIDIDRLSIALGTGRNCKIEAVSGLDSIERRADHVKRLGRLAAMIIKTKQPLWYDGDESSLPPQVERSLHDYLDKSHSKTLAIIPLYEQQTNLETDVANRRIRAEVKPLGALIVEQMKDSAASETLRQRVDVVARHSEIALTNAFEHHSIFLMPVWKSLGQVVGLFGEGRRWKTIAALCGLGMIASFLAIYPYRFGLSAAGNLVPEVQYEVFALESGVLSHVFVSDDGNTMVAKDQVLAKMFNNDLDVEISKLEGQIKKDRLLLASKEQLQGRNLDPIDAHQNESEINSLRTQIRSTEDELGLRMHQRELLKVLSPADGQVVNWQARQRLLGRPVRQGQHLMTIVDPETNWQIELRMPERRVAHMLRAMQESKEPLPVKFGLMSQPGVEYVGHVLNIDRQLDVHSDDGNTALVRVVFQNRDVPRDLLRSGTRVTAKVECGERSIGYVMFHELMETVHTKWLLWK